MADEIVSVWKLDLDRCPPAAAVAALSPDEQKRALRFHTESLRRRWRAAHAGLRMILAAETGARSADMGFTAGPYGKPELRPGDEPHTRFNLSHSGPFGLVAVSRGVEIGVDVETLERRFEPARLARSFLDASEQDAILSVPPHRRRAAFLRVWTAKEAYLKACGHGLTGDLASFVVDAPLVGPLRVVRDEADANAPTCWRLVPIAWADVAIAAVCVPSSARVVVRHIRELCGDARRSSVRSVVRSFA